MANEDLLLRAIASKAHSFSGNAGDFEPLLELTQGANCVLLGEASHGTHEFYHQRARLTKLLITEQHFSAVAVEADWPDAYRVNRYVLGLGSDADAEAALSDFKRFPSWMWRNADVLDFVGCVPSASSTSPTRNDRATTTTSSSRNSSTPSFTSITLALSSLSNAALASATTSPKPSQPECEATRHG